MSRGFEIASGAAAAFHGLDEEAGKLAGDSVYGPYNNLLGEFNFFAISLQVAGMLDKLSRNRMHPIDFRIDIGARALGLATWDYAMIADEKGKLRTKGRRARCSPEQLREYVKQAHLLYDASVMPVEYGEDSVVQQRWRCKANAFEKAVTVEQNDWIPSLQVVPHLGALTLATMGFTARAEGKHSPFAISFEHFKERLEHAKERGSMNHITSASNTMAQELTVLSNELVALDPIATQSSKPFMYLDPNNSRNASRAALQVLAVNYLKAATAREPVVSTMMTDIAYSAWGMTRMGAAEFTDDGLEKELLHGQWGLGTVADPYWVREDKVYNQKVRDLLEWQMPSFDRT